MKKALSLILALAMILALTACGSKTDAPEAMAIPRQIPPLRRSFSRSATLRPRTVPPIRLC